MKGKQSKMSNAKPKWKESLLQIWKKGHLSIVHKTPLLIRLTKELSRIFERKNKSVKLISCESK